MTANCGHRHHDGITPARGSEEERCDAGVAAAYLIRRELGVPLEAETDAKQREELRDMLDPLGLLDPSAPYVTDMPRAFSGPS